MKRTTTGIAIALALAAAGVLADVGPDVKVYGEPGWCVWCPSPVALPDGRFALAGV